MNFEKISLVFGVRILYLPTVIGCLLIHNACSYEPFRPGEKLVYEASWGIIKAAQLEFEISQTPSNSKYPPGVLVFRAKCRSVGVINKIYPINSTVETYAFANNLKPILHTEERSEGSHKYNRTMTFDFASKIGVWSNKISGKDKRVRLPHVAYDPLGAFYAIRKNGILPKTTNTLEIITDGKYEKIKYSVSEPETKSLGKWAPLQVLQINSNDIMEHAVKRKASVKMYVTSDPSHIPLQIDMKTSWGKVRLELIEVHGSVQTPLQERENKRSVSRKFSRI